MAERVLRIATRRSALALWQAEHIAALIRAARPGAEVELVHVVTEGDRDQQTPLASLGGTGVFTREVQRAVLDDRADLAVHSLKDLPTAEEPGLVLAGVPARASVRDLLVLPVTADGAQADGPRHESPAAENLLDVLPEGAVVGTASLRRQAQLLHHRPDLQMTVIRGNVETRLRKLDEGQCAALVLAEAGLSRLDLLEGRQVIPLVPPLMLGAVGQGALGLECRQTDAEVIELLAELSVPGDRAGATAERRVLQELRAGCHAPLGAVTRLTEGQLTLECVVLSVDGTERIHTSASGPADSPDELGRQVAGQLLKLGAAELLAPAGEGGIRLDTPESSQQGDG
ncbi:MAG: hydroxymethylbilane synthase [Planctomycetaceae bacterium]|nr:hydroxymethylbilane synthase [Planctomycetaceae bacterium]